MTVIDEGDDALTLELVKAHVLVEHDDDDTILTHYIDASLYAVEQHCHTQFLRRTWEAQPDELDRQDGRVIVLVLPTNPKSITITAGSEFELMPYNWYYCGGIVTVYLDEAGIADTVTAVEAVTGSDEANPSISQARLMIIASYYANRENESFGLTANDLPSGAIQFLLPVMQEVAI